MSIIEKPAEVVKNAASSILGTFSGKCCDSNVFNNNDMLIGRDVFQGVIDSDEYKRAIKYYHYIGFLGHPSDTDCQDFEHACIVMTDMRILDNGEIEGDFDLIDTPVGRIVKAFIDAGVKFGISIRGLGDVASDGVVDPEGFVFRGFDLVTFPAYNDCIPEFKAVAASTDVKHQAKLKKVYASIDANLDSIDSPEALVVIQEQLPEDSEEFAKIQERIDSLNSDGIEEATIEESENEIYIKVLQEKLDAVTNLYLDAAENLKQLQYDLINSQNKCTELKNELQCAEADKQKLQDDLVKSRAFGQKLNVECRTLKQRHAKLDKITANQIVEANNNIDVAESKYRRSERQLQRVKASLSTTRNRLSDTQNEIAGLQNEIAGLQKSYDKQVTANTRLQERIESLNEKRKDDQKTIKSCNDLNLKYKRKIEANSEAISQKDSTIEDLEKRLNETVIASQKFESEASNLGDRNEELLSRVEAAEEMVSSYQQAYANIYANALGVYLTGLPVTASTSVEELKSMIKAGTSTANIASSPGYYEASDDEYVEDDFDGDVTYSADMVTM